MKLLKTIGQYVLFMQQVFTKPVKRKIFTDLFVEELYAIGIGSLIIVLIISFFMGAVVAIQTAYNIDSPLIPSYTVGYIVKQSIILEFSPTIISIFLTGKIGSRIASSIGTMRVTEQVDALQVMGVNPANYLVLPKLLAAILIIPVLIALSIVVAIFGGYLVSFFSDNINTSDFVYGLQSFVVNKEVYYALIKTAVFAFFIVSISAFYGFNVKGGAIEVGKASTKAVVSCSIAIIVSDLILTKLILG